MLDLDRFNRLFLIFCRNISIKSFANLNSGLTARDKHALYLQQVEEGRNAIELAKNRHAKLVEDTTIELKEALRHSKVIIFVIVIFTRIIYHQFITRILVSRKLIDSFGSQNSI